ncbi:structural protein [Erwinia phage Aioli]|nr:structural protein [Erwinia phage Aioli]
MSDIIGDVGTALSGAASKLKSKFSYGPHPSIIMWAAGPATQVQDKDDSILGSIGEAISGARAKLENIVTSTPDPSQFNSFKFDAMVSESHLAQSTVTKVPVSTGFVVSEHIINHNRILKLEAVATNMQNSAMWAVSAQGLSVVSGAIFNNPILPQIGGLYGVVSSAFETENRIESTYNLFNGLRTSGTKLYISTILGKYLNCVITEIRTKHDKLTASMLAVEITLEELQTIGKDDIAKAAATAIDNSYDYSEFAKVATGLGVGVLGGVPLPGLGSLSNPTAQLGVLKDKLAKLSQPISAIKGRIL